MNCQSSPPRNGGWSSCFTTSGRCGAVASLGSPYESVVRVRIEAADDLYGGFWSVPRNASAVVFIGKCIKKIGFFLVFAIAGIFLASGASLAQTSVGSCTPGARQCQVDTVMECHCYDDVWREDDEREEGFFLVCEWVSTAESCGITPPPAACTPAYQGATHKFPDSIKECRCREGVCAWE